MRVHGTLKINRRELKITNWKNHRLDLEKDFCGICGYCGKHFALTRCTSQIDHFIPKKDYPDYENLYSNLVLACRVCNNKKRNDWPSKDPTKSVTEDRTKGYIDPATDEFDLHLERCEDGNIIGKTLIGEYMCKRLGFEYRPISECHKIMMLRNEIECMKIKKSNGDLNFSESALNDLFAKCESLMDYIYEKKE